MARLIFEVMGRLSPLDKVRFAASCVTRVRPAFNDWEGETAPYQHQQSIDAAIGFVDAVALEAVPFDELVALSHGLDGRLASAWQAAKNQKTGSAKWVVLATSAAVTAAKLAVASRMNGDPLLNDRITTHIYEAYQAMCR